MSPFQLRLPQVVVRVDETRRYDFPATIHRFRVGLGGGRHLDILVDTRYDVSHHEDVGVVQWNHTVVRRVGQDDSTSKEN